MSNYYIYKLLKTGYRPVAKIEIGQGVTVSTCGVEAARIVRAALSHPALLTERRGRTMTKRAPRTMEESVVARLRRHIRKPFFATKDAPKQFECTDQFELEMEDPDDE